MSFKHELALTSRQSQPLTVSPRKESHVGSLLEHIMSIRAQPTKSWKHNSKMS